MVDHRTSSASPPAESGATVGRDGRPVATTPSFSFTEAMASYFPFRFDNPEVTSPVPDVVKISQTRILLARLLPDELVDPIMRYAGLTFDHLSERDEGRPVVFHDSSGRIWAMPDRQARDQVWTFLRSRPLVGPTDVQFARRLAGEPEDGEEEKQAEDEEEYAVVADDHNKRNPWRIKRITVMTNSRDQGWSNDEAHHGESPMLCNDSPNAADSGLIFTGTYAHAYSWFEVVVERDGVLLDGAYLLQYNMHGELGGLHLRTLLNLLLRHAASGRPRVHLNDLPLDHELFRKLRRGDRLLLLAKARYPVRLICFNFVPDIVQDS